MVPFASWQPDERLHAAWSVTVASYAANCGVSNQERCDCVYVIEARVVVATNRANSAEGHAGCVANTVP